MPVISTRQRLVFYFADYKSFQSFLKSYILYSYNSSIAAFVCIIFFLFIDSRHLSLQWLTLVQLSEAVAHYFLYWWLVASSGSLFVGLCKVSLLLIRIAHKLWLAKPPIKVWVVDGRQLSTNQVDTRFSVCHFKARGRKLVGQKNYSQGYAVWDDADSSFKPLTWLYH